MKWQMQVLESANRLVMYEVEATTAEAAERLVHDGEGKCIEPNEPWEISVESIETEPEECE